MIRVVGSAESAAGDAATIAAGVPSRALMQRAGAAAATELALRHRDLLARPVLVLAGPGNNGGDAWVVARALAAAGTRVAVCEPLEAKTPDARAERALALPFVESVGWHDDRSPWRGEPLVVDGLLGTGASGVPRGAIAAAIDFSRDARARGATVVALDLPSGLDATTGEGAGALDADLTLTFGTVKRGHLASRGRCGTIVVLDIGLVEGAPSPDAAPRLVDDAWAAARLPRIAAEAHKGTRRKLVVVGGGEGMAGAAILAARASLRSGIGMVRVLVAPESVRAVQEAEPPALAGAWPADDAALERDVLAWADAIVLGPGLGASDAARDLASRILARWRGPLLLDADAINHWTGAADRLGDLLATRQALLTPHPAELARLTSATVSDILARRFDVGRDAARRARAAVLLKGTPTVVTAPSGERLVSAAGTPILATGGSGDVLSGIAGTLLAQIGDPLVAGALAAHVHGRAAELLGGGTRGIGDRESEGDPDLDEPIEGVGLAQDPSPVLRSSSPAVRGFTLDDVLATLPRAWAFDEAPTRYPVLLELPVVGER